MKGLQTGTRKRRLAGWILSAVLWGSAIFPAVGGAGRAFAESPEAAAVDANGHPAAFEGTTVWQASPSLGSFDTSGNFTTGTSAGTSSVQVTASYLTGTGEVEDIADLSELKFPDAEKAVDSGAQVALSVKALRNGQEI